MKVMGSAVMAFEIIVIALAMPIAVVLDGQTKSQVVGVGVALMILCMYAIGAMRKARKKALITGSLVQAIVLLSGLWIGAYLVPGIIFGLCWILAVWLSGKIDAAKFELDNHG